MFAAGYDVRTPEKFAKVMEEFDKKVGFRYLKGMHLNGASLLSHAECIVNLLQTPSRN